MKDSDNRNVRPWRAAVCVLVALLLCAFSPRGASAADYEAGHTAILYDMSAGMPFSEANAIAQTPDGFVYIGGYGGLLRYDGRTFVRVDELEESVVSLLTDSRGRLWAAGSGAHCMERGVFRHYTAEDGLPSRTVRAIAEDASGNLYFATAAGVAVLDAQGTLRTVEDERLSGRDVETVSGEGVSAVYGTTMDGDAFAMMGTEVIAYADADALGAEVSCAFPDPAREGAAYFGTRDGDLLYGDLASPDGIRRIPLPALSYVNAVLAADGVVWVCADNGIAYLDETGEARLLRHAPMTGTVYDVMRDHEGNLWFVSSRQGVMKLVENIFADVSGMSDMGERVVNTTWKKDGVLYAGTDTGLVTLDEGYQTVDNPLADLLGSARVRAIKEDGAGNLWFCSFDENTLVCLKPDGSRLVLRKEDGLLSSYARTIYERADGTMALSVTGGVHLLRDGALSATFDEQSGMRNTTILSICEDDAGTLYLGSNGDGVYVVDGARVLPFPGESDVVSGVILAMKNDPGRDVVWVVSSNALAYLKDGAMHTVTNLTGSHIYDILFSDDGKLWIMSASGVTVADGDALLSGGPSGELASFRAKDGAMHVTTPNSRSYVSPEGEAFLACADGIMRFNVNRWGTGFADVLLAVPYIEADGRRVYVSERGDATVPPDTRRVNLCGFALSYAFGNPNIAYWLEGFDEHPYVVEKDRLEPASYTNLPGGSYTFHLAQLDPATGAAVRETTITLVKEKRARETAAFWVFLALLAAGAAVLLHRYLLRRQEKQAEKKREQERIEKELGMAANIQSDMLPSDFPAFPNRTEFDVYATMHPAKEVGGDFYDFFLVDDNHLALAVADVSGKGVPAALFMMIAKTLLKDTASMGMSPARVLGEVNAQLCDNNKNNMFVTVWLGVLEISTGRLVFADGGHERPLLYHDGTWSYVAKHNGVALAVMEPELLELEDDPAFVDQELTLAPGDVLLQYTDGVPEATNARQELYGDERLLDAMNRAPSTEPDALLPYLRAQVDDFVRGAPQFDDITMLAVRLNRRMESEGEGTR